LRDSGTKPSEFRQLVRSLAQLLTIEATCDLATQPIEVQTPLARMLCEVLADRVGVIPILRAGLGMADGVLELIPNAEVWHIGLFRDERTLEPHEYYNKLRSPARISVALVLDPMLATGGSAIRTCQVVRSAGVDRIKMISLIAAPEGLSAFSKALPDIPIYVGVVDQKLNDVGFIVPGLGDAGDRQFATT
jgi:uracil phosphoribosyltransferase